MVTRLTRVVCPAWIDTWSFSCTTVWRQSVKSFGSTCVTLSNDSPNKDFKVNPVFQNKNPRNLEYMGLARKRQGWVLQFPRKDYYHKLFFERSVRNTSGWIEHASGDTVVSASTKEWAIRQHLYSCTDVSAAQNVGRVLAQRCLECGLDHIFYDKAENLQPSEAMEAFLQAVEEGQVSLQEPAQVRREYQPGIDYEKPNRYGEKKKLKDDYQPA